MKKVQPLICIISLVATTLFLFSCNKTGKESNKENEEMYNNLVSGYNILIKEVPQMIKDYNKSITDKRIANPSFLNLSPLVNVDVELKKARTFYEAGIKAAPSSYSDLCAAAVRMIDSSDEVYKAYMTTNDYIQREDWSTDTDGTILAAQRKTFNEIGEKYHAAADEVDSGLEAIEIEMAQAELKKFEKEKGYSYWYRFANIEAKKSY